jgi:hypothetical protein
MPNKEMNLKAFQMIDCPMQSIISTKVLDFLSTNTTLLEDKNLKLWNKIDTVDLIKQVPEILKFYQSINLKLQEIAITICNKYEDVSLHIDELPVVSKINFPILNTENTFNEWYRVPKEILDTVTPVVNQFGSAFYDLKSVDLDQCIKIAEVELTQPIIFNSQIPHRIRITDQAKLPRIVMSCTFFNQPIELLSK